MLTRASYRYGVRASPCETCRYRGQRAAFEEHSLIGTGLVLLVQFDNVTFRTSSSSERREIICLRLDSRDRAGSCDLSKGAAAQQQSSEIQSPEYFHDHAKPMYCNAMQHSRRKNARVAGKAVPRSPARSDLVEAFASSTSRSQPSQSIRIPPESCPRSLHQYVFSSASSCGAPGPCRSMHTTTPRLQGADLTLRLHRSFSARMDRR